MKIIDLQSRPELNFSPYFLIGVGVCQVLSFAMVVAPLALLAMYVTGKVMAFQLPDQAYLRAAGIAAVPTVLIVLATHLYPSNEGIKVVAMLAILPVCFFMLRYAFDMEWKEAGVGLLLGSASYILAMFLSAAVVLSASGALAVALKPSKRVARSEDEDPYALAAPRSNRATPTGVPSGKPAPNPPSGANDTSSQDASALLQRIAAVQSAAPAQGPDAGAASLDDIGRTLKSKKAAMPDAPDWTNVEQAIAAARAELAQLPPASPSADLFQPISAAGPFPMPLATYDPKIEEVSIGTLRFRPPAGVMIDLRTSEPGKRLDYSVGGVTRLRVSFLPRTNPRQLRPFVLLKPYQRFAAETQKLLMIDSTGSSSDLTFGLIGGIPFARTERFEAGSQTFITPSADCWLIVSLPSAGAPDVDAASLASLQSFHPAGAGDKFSDPLGIERIADQLGSEPSRVGDLYKAQPAVAEPILIQQLSSPNFAIRREAARLLPQLATAQSIPALEQLASSSTVDEVTQAARQALQRLDPKRFSPIGDALADLKSDNSRKVDAAITLLAEATPQEKYRLDVSTALEDLLLDTKTYRHSDEKVARALALWHGPKTVARLAPILNNPSLYGSRRDNLILALSGCSDKLAAAAVIKWMIAAPDQVSTALIKIGPVAEDETLRILGANFGPGPQAAGVRSNCVRVLNEIGGYKSLELLGRASRDSRDTVTQLLAKEAIENAKARAAAAKAGVPATKPASRPGN